MVYLGLGYLLALAAIAGLAEGLAPELGPWLYGLLLLLLLAHTALSRNRPSGHLPLLLALAPLARLALTALGCSHPAGRALSLGLPTLAALNAARKLLGLPLPRPRPIGPLPEAERPHVISLGLGYLLALAGITGLAEGLAPEVGPWLYGLLLLLLLAHTALSRNRPSGRLPLLLALAPLARLALAALGCSHPAGRALALGLPPLAAAAAALGLLGLQIRPLQPTRFRFVPLLYRRICDQRDLALLCCVLLRTRLALRLRDIRPPCLSRLTSHYWTLLKQKPGQARMALERLFHDPATHLFLRRLQTTAGQIYREYLPLRAALSAAAILIALLSIGPDYAYMANGDYSAGPATPMPVSRQEEVQAKRDRPSTTLKSSLSHSKAAGTTLDFPEKPTCEIEIIQEVQGLALDVNHPRPVPIMPDQPPKGPTPKAKSDPPGVAEEAQQNNTPAEPAAAGAGIAYTQTNGQNPYPWGQCTWYAWSRRPDLPWFVGENGHARGWAISAQGYGLLVDSNPTVGSIAVFQPWVHGGHPVYGHVAYVEEVRENGLLISECNLVYEALLPDYPRWWEGGGACGYRFIPFDQLDSSMQFIH